MTSDQKQALIAAILTAQDGSLTAQDKEDLNSCSEEGLGLLLQGYIDQRKPLPVSTWQEILDVIQKIDEFAKLVAPITSLIGTLISLV
jgi:hypothetical protein